MYSLVFQQKLGQRWQYVLQHDYATEPGAGADGTTACWYGIDQYLFYTINERWKAGVRYEWFHDPRTAHECRRRTAHQTDGDYYELSTGLNWRPNEQDVRPELRWDWTRTHDLLSLRRRHPLEPTAVGLRRGGEVLVSPRENSTNLLSARRRTVD